MHIQIEAVGIQEVAKNSFAVSAWSRDGVEWKHSYGALPLRQAMKIKSGVEKRGSFESQYWSQTRTPSLLSENKHLAASVN